MHTYFQEHRISIITNIHLQISLINIIEIQTVRLKQVVCLRLY